MRPGGRAVVATAWAVLLWPPLAVCGASAESLRAGGLIFSDELGGFKLLSASGSGTTEDPIRIEEVLLGTGPIYLTIRRADMSPGEAGQRQAYPALGQVITKVVRNGSRRVWSGFDIELRQEFGRPSTYADGLSFDQPSGAKSEADSDRFAKVRHINEPFDMLSFYDGHVDPGGRVGMAFKITDPTPSATLYMVQQPQLLLVRRSGTDLARMARDD
jgi:hypothetical protein